MSRQLFSSWCGISAPKPGLPICEESLCSMRVFTGKAAYGAYSPQKGDNER
jgi:hypothetical protein